MELNLLRLQLQLVLAWLNCLPVDKVQGPYWPISRYVKKKKSCLFLFVRQFSGNLILLPVSCFCFHTHNRHSCKWLYNAKCRCNCSKKWPPNRRVNRPTANPAPLCLAACLSALLLFIFSLWSILFCFSSLPDSLTTFALSQ